MNICEMTALEISNAVKNKEISVKDAVDAFFAAIDESDGKYHCYNTLCKKEAYERAEEVQKGIDSGKYNGRLAGVPIGIKDNICTKDILTTCSSKILENFIPTYNATVVNRLNDEGMVIIGKLNMDEFAMGSTTETSATGVTHNPWDTDKVPGGSSGGAAAAVAARLSPVALGSDTGGSIRQPASFNGIVGIKPTYGRVSRYGCVAFASSLDQIGPITRDVTDAAIVLNTICGLDKHDSTSLPVDVPDFTKALRQDVKGLRIGLPKEFYGAGLDPKVDAELKKAVEVYRSLGAEIVDISLPSTEYAVITYYIIAPAEASANLARYDGVRYGFRASNATSAPEMTTLSRTEGFGPEVRRRIMLGTYVLSSGYYDAYYKKAMQVRTLIRREYDEAFKKCDVLLTPTSPVPAYNINSQMDPLAIYLLDVCTIPVNLAGLPGISVPCGFAGGMPVGMQLIGKPLDEETVLRAAYTFEQATNFRQLAPLGGKK